jgi:two-component system, cell cycle sensor histidine kinase and response regulator CckA
MNLALNARDAMPKGGRLIIGTSAIDLNDQQTNRHAEAYPGKFVCLTVADTGFGMDEPTLQRIFEPFFTTKEVGKGTGLGLSTVYGIVKQHHGWIEVASKKGQGASFTIFIPISTTAPHASQKLPTLPVNGGSETILFVEDEPDIRKLARQILERYGYRVLEAGCGVEALKVWEQNKDKVDLLLTDMVMPEGMTGRDLAKQLQTQKSGLKVIFTSGYSVETLEKDFQLGQNEGAFRFLPKPYQPQRLAEIIRESLDSKN